MVLKADDAALRYGINAATGAERAFRVFTEEIHDWWPGSHRLGGAERTGLVFEPRPGGRWYERTADGGERDWGEVRLWEPPRHLVLSWRIGAGWELQADPERASEVEIKFVEDGWGRTTVTLIHSELRRHGEGWRSVRDGVSGADGWPEILRSYEDRLQA